MSYVLALVLLAWPVVTVAPKAAPVHAQSSSLSSQTPSSQQPPSQPQAPPPSPPPQFEQTVEVVGVTPIHGLGLDANKVPANVQVLTAGAISPATLDVPDLLGARAASVHINDAQAGAFQPDVLFRGFTGSPLLGASEGLAVYQDGVRLNEGFGDTVNWDALPTFAIASINVMPGSNPLFGLNALGGALSIQTKDGFAFSGTRAAVTTGSFGRHRVQAETGRHGDSVGYFVAGSLVDESGWRDHSPSTTRQLFGDLAWRGAASKVNVSLTAASNDMTGNGAAPVRLLEEDRDAVFTHPDRTDNDLALVTVRGQRQLSRHTLVDGVLYYRHTRIGTFNGDAADDDDADDDDDDDDDHAGVVFDGVNNLSTTRGRATGATLQLTRTAALLGRANHFIAGAGLDTASSRFDFAAELAELTEDRGTIGSGIFDEDAFVDLRTRTTTASAFVTDTWSPTARLSVSASARFNITNVRLRDQIGTSLNGDHRFRRVNPAVGITYQLRPRVNLYGSYAQSSRVPTPVELTCADPEDPCRLPNAFVSDPPLDQIVAGTWEAGARGRAGQVAWTIAGFDTEANDDIIFVSSGTLRGEGHFENVEKTRRRGLETSLDFSHGDRLSLFATYTVQRATFETDLRIASRFHPLADDTEIDVVPGDRLPGVQTHSGKVGASALIRSGLHVNVNVRAQSAQYMRGDESNQLPHVPGFAVMDAGVVQRITPHVSVIAHVRNIFDTRFYTFGVLGDAELLGEAFEDDPRFYSPGAPRAAWLGLDVRF